MESGHDLEESPNKESEVTPAQETNPKESERRVEVSPAKTPSNQEQEEKPQAYKPVTDIKMLEQIDFDAININSEDINQANQQQNVIGSSESDHTPNENIEEDFQQEEEHPEFIDTEEDEEQAQSPDSNQHPEPEVDKFKQIAMIGTDLHVIESNSNEVSQSTENQNESLHQIIQRQMSTQQQNDDADDNIDEQQNLILDQLQKKNEHAVRMLKQEKLAQTHREVE